MGYSTWYFSEIGTYFVNCCIVNVLHISALLHRNNNLVSLYQLDTVDGSMPLEDTNVFSMIVSDTDVEVYL